MAVQINRLLLNHRINSLEKNSFKETIADKDLIEQCSQNPNNKKHLVTLYEKDPRELIAFLQYAIEHADRLYHYVNKGTSWANWNDTLSLWRRNLALKKRVEKVLAIIPDAKGHVGAVYAASKRFGDSVIQRAVTAKETAKDGTFKYFCWLTSEQRRLEYSQNT